MPALDISKATKSDQENRVDEYEIPAMQTEGISDQKETAYINSNWAQQWGYFNAVPDLKSALIMKSVWNVGKGYTTDPETKVTLEHINGWGKDTFDDIMFNMDIIKRVGGDSYAEIMKDEKTGKLINLKVLDTGSIRIVVDGKGVIKRYEQVNKIGGKTKVQHKWEPKEIFHLSHNRLADQIHGISDIIALEKTILADEESFDDMKKIMHRQAKPMIMFKLKTDDQATIDAFIVKMDKATNLGENIYIPDDENAVSFEVVQVNVSALTLAWRDGIRNRFYRNIGLPQVVPGAGGQSTESESKVIYLAFEQIVEKEQRELEEQIWNQLFLKVDFAPPVTLQANLQSDIKKDASQGLGFQPGETTAGVSA